MGLLTWLGTSVVVLLVAHCLNFMLLSNIFEKVYSHRPGKCRAFTMNGSEDMVLLPSNQVLVSSGLHFWKGKLEKPEANIFMLDLNVEDPSPVPLKFEDGYLDEYPNFTPHGMGYWQNNEQEVFLYVVCHWPDRKDTIEVFQYCPKTLSLKLVKSISGELINNINDVVVVGDMEFYATNDHYFNNRGLYKLEPFLLLPITGVIYYNGRTGEQMFAATGLKYPNGIAKSNNGRFIYVNNLLKGEVDAFTRNSDNTLQYVENFPLLVAPDNVFVDPTNGHLWITILHKPLITTKYIAEDRSLAVPSKVVHITANESSDAPLSGANIEEVFVTTGEDFEELKAATVSVYHNHTLLIGSIAHNLMVCRVSYLMYT